MNGDADGLSVRLSADASSLKQELASTRQAIRDYAEQSTRSYEDVGRSSEQSSRRSASALGQIMPVLGRLTGVAGVALLARQVWQTGREFHEFSQNAETALSGMLGGVDQARAFMGDVLDFARQTPFAFPELTETAQQLLAMNVAATDIIPTLRSLGDAALARGQGMERVRQLAGIIGQINTIGVLSNNELRRLQEAGLPVMVGLANLAGVTTQEFRQMVSDGIIPADQALRDLRVVIDEGTDGINGQTVAMGGMMENIKGADGLTATADAASSAFRNMSKELTESLLPTYTSLLQTATAGMGVIRGTAEQFNQLPRPVRDSALAFGAALIAVRLLNVQGRATGVWRAYTAQMLTAQAAVAAKGAAATRTTVALNMMRTAGRGAGTALLGALGGPVGLAATATLTALTLGLSAYSQAQAEARQRAQEFADTLDAQTGAITDNTQTLVRNALAAEQNWNWGGSGTSTMVEMADRMGISIDLLTDAYLGNAEAISQVRQQTRDWMDENRATPDVRAAAGFIQELDAQVDSIERGRRVNEAARRAAEQMTEETNRQADAYSRGTTVIREFTEEQQKVIDQAEELARSSFEAAARTVGTDLNVSTEEDLAKARQDVEMTARGVRDAEERLADTRKNDRATARDRRRDEEALADARRKNAEAVEHQADVEDRADPARQYQRRLEETLKAAEDFDKHIEELAVRGLSPQRISELLNAGFEGAAGDVQALLLGGDDLIALDNEFLAAMSGIEDSLASHARLAAAAVERTGDDLGDTFGLAFQVSALSEVGLTAAQIVTELGGEHNLMDIRKVGAWYAIALKSGFDSYYSGDLVLGGSFAPGGAGGPLAPRPFAQGGIYPGYTPGRDIGLIGVSGGEAIMRPEWTRAVGPSMVNEWNQIARSGGVAGVRAAMERYLGGYNQGGTVSQVVTVPVSSTHTREAPISIANAWFRDPGEVGGWGDRQRAQDWKAGG